MTTRRLGPKDFLRRGGVTVSASFDVENQQLLMEMLNELKVTNMLLRYVTQQDINVDDLGDD